MPEEEEEGEERGMGKLHNTVECPTKTKRKTVVGFVVFHYKLVWKAFK